jgi:WD40 repeat protein
VLPERLPLVDSQDGTQRRIAELLIGYVRQASLGWLGVNAYIRQHLPTHASHGELLADLIRDAGFLGAAEPERLLPELLPLASHPDPMVAGVARAYMRLGAARVGGTFVQRIVNVDLEHAAADPAERLALDVYAAFLPWRLIFATGRAAAVLERPHIGSQDLSAVTAGDTGAGELVATATLDHHIQIWNVCTGGLVRDWKAHHELIRGLCLARDETSPRLVSAGADATIRLWDPQAGTLLQRMPIASPAICAVPQSDTGLTVLVGSEDGVVRTLDLGMNRPGPEWQAHRDGVASLAVGEITGTPVAVSGGLDRVLNVWRLSDRENLLSLTGPIGSIIAVAMGVVDGRPIVASGNSDESVWIWDAVTGEPLHSLTGHDAGVTSVAFAVVGDVAMLASGSSDMTIRLWDCATGACLRVLRGHRGGIKALTFGQVDGDLRLVSVGADRALRITDPADGSSVGPAEPADGDTDSIWVWGDGQAPTQSSSEVPGGPVRAVTFAQLDGERIVASAVQDGYLQLRDAVTGEVRAVWQAHEGGALATATLRLGDRLVVASGGHDAAVRLFDAADGTPIATLEGHQRSVWGVATGLLHGRPIVVSGSRDRSVRVWDAERGHALHVLTGSKERIWGVACDLINGRSVIAAASTDRSIWLWDAETGELIRRLYGHSRGSRFVTFGRLRGQPVVAASSADRTVRVWDYTRGVLTTTLRGHTDGVWGIAAGTFQDRMILASAGDDLSVRIWDVQTQRSLSLPQASPAYAVDLQEGHVAIGTDRHVIAVDLLDSLFDDMGG